MIKNHINVHFIAYQYDGYFNKINIHFSRAIKLCDDSCSAKESIRKEAIINFQTFERISIYRVSIYIDLYRFMPSAQIDSIVKIPRVISTVRP